MQVYLSQLLQRGILHGAYHCNSNVKLSGKIAVVCEADLLTKEETPAVTQVEEPVLKWSG